MLEHVQRWVADPLSNLHVRLETEPEEKGLEEFILELEKRTLKRDITVIFKCWIS